MSASVLTKGCRNAGRSGEPSRTVAATGAARRAASADGTNGSEAVQRYAPAKPFLVFVVVMWFSLVGSVLGVMTHLLMMRFGFRWYLQLSQDFIWMTSVTEVVIFLVPALVLVVLCR